MPVLVDFSEIKAEVRVPFDSIAGPSFEEARDSAAPVAAEHCRSLGKRTVYVSGRDESEDAGTIGEETKINIYETEYVFLYRCEGVSPPHVYPVDRQSGTRSSRQDGGGGHKAARHAGGE
ncbi:MAG: hypothetical protein OXJ53_19010 [Gammaproteobacteria bacterium]|nr:hypothetical protein [Gammaproteobacteria bacterium]MDE0273236.1 hypothetical protein [Gammaproteobacteria bacterium]